MKVCFFGSYIGKEYNMLIKKNLELQNVEIIECQENVKGIFSLLIAYPKLFFKHIKMDYDVMIVPWRGVMTIPLAKLISKGPIVYFAFISIYDTLVNDRKLIKPKSLKAKFLHFVDKKACKIADIIILDSFGEIDYFVDEFDIERSKFRRLFLGADETKFPPQKPKKTNEKFIFLYFGKFIPLHGVDVIIKAAKILANYSDIVFKLCGEGQTKPEMEKLVQKNRLKNVEFLGFVTQEKLLENIKKSDACAGIYSQGNKAMKVITNKIFQVLASHRTLITMDSNGIKEIQVANQKNCILIPPNNPQALADAILFLKNNPAKREEMASEGHRLFLDNYSMRNLGKTLLNILKEVNQRS